MTKEEFEELCRFKLLGKPENQVVNFIEYWTETDLKGKKMRFESEKFFDPKRRFATYERLLKQWHPEETNPLINAINQMYKQESRMVL